MNQDALVLQVSTGFGQALETTIDKDNVVVKAPINQVLPFIKFARTQLGFDMLSSITAVDNGDAFELLYHLVSIRPNETGEIEPSYPGYLLVRVRVPRTEDEPVVPSLTSIYAGANQQEREIWDLMGIRFKGHPKLERILLWEGFPGHPLRKDWLPLNVEIPWHLAGLKGFGGELMADAPAIARIADDGSGISQPIPQGTTPMAFNHPASRPSKPTERLHIKIGQGGVTDHEGAAGPRDPGALQGGGATVQPGGDPEPAPGAPGGVA